MVSTMARKKSGRPKGAREPRKLIAGFKGYAEFAEWIERLAAHQRLPISVLIEHALIEYARTHGFDEQAPER